MIDAPHPVGVMETTLLQIEQYPVSMLLPHPEAEAIPISEEDKQALRDGITRDGVKTPLHITPDRRILDGMNRWEIAKELNILSLPVIVFHYQNPVEESLHIIKANLQRRHLNEGQRAMLLLEMDSFQQELEQQQQEAQERLRLSKGQGIKVVPQGTTLKGENGKAVDKVAKAKGVSPRTMYRAKAVKKANPQKARAVKQNKVSLTKAYQQVKAEEKAEEVRELQEAERLLTDLEIMDKLGIKVQPYDLWQFSECDDRFGHDYPGRIPGQLVAHCLYYWTEQGDTVLDPMAGSGTTIDVCELFNRRVLAYDAHPCREDITQHDMAVQGWPEQTAEAKLIFWDPPYFKKVDDGYGDKSISRLSRSAYLAFFEHMATTIPDAFHGSLAFLMSPYRDIENPLDSIWVHDYVNLFLSHGWHIQDLLNVPLTSQRVSPQQIKRFRDSKLLAWLMRDLVVMERPKS